MQGAILYADALERIIPDFRDDAPLERHVIEQRVWVLSDDAYVGSTYRSAAFDKPPYNRYTIIRAQFDKWFSQKVQEAGALLLCETTVTGLVMDGDRVAGVHTDRGGTVYADLVILGDGVNSLLANKAGFHPELKPRDVALAVKEIHFLPEATIESRFNVQPDQGVVIEMAGKITQGMVGTGFLYTNRESLTIGVGCLLSDFKANGVPPYQMLEDMKKHPAIAPLLEGGEMKEYCAHLIPEGGYKAVPQVYGHGWLMVGDAAMLVNSVHREGSQPGHDLRPPGGGNGARTGRRRQGHDGAQSGRLPRAPGRQLRAQGPEEIPAPAAGVRPQPPVLHRLPGPAQRRRPHPAHRRRRRQENQGKTGAQKLRHAPLAAGSGGRCLQAVEGLRMIKVEEKLFQNRYRVDAGRPHISIIDASVCQHDCPTKQCTVCCPAACYTREGDGRVTLITDGCLECGTCRVICTDHRNVAWEYPRGGYGILFKFG